MNQTVSLYEFGTVERAFSPACQTNCFQGEALAAYDPCGNMISLVASSTRAEAWSRAIDKNSDSTIGMLINLLSCNLRRTAWNQLHILLQPCKVMFIAAENDKILIQDYN